MCSRQIRFDPPSFFDASPPRQNIAAKKIRNFLKESPAPFVFKG
jgi:hypothetical protein